ncbi:MAG: AMP-binding protein [Alphaproteobacteria bacterium]|nr:AMP-binding protein [Alphaproteobacteria bacterium]
MLTRAATYADVRRAMRWAIPARFNMGVDVCDKHAAADPGRLAMIVEDEEGRVARHTYGEARALSNKMANLLLALGLKRGDRVGILLSQSLETPVAHIGAWKAGMISIPLFTLFGEDALEYRLTDSGARAIVTDKIGLAKIAGIRDRLPDLAAILVAGPAEGIAITGQHNLWAGLDRASADFVPVDTATDDPGLIIYTSGTTGNPKGALHAHRALLGHLPGVEFPHEFLPQPNDLMWTPADWAWIGGLMNVLMGSWHHGVPVLASRMRKYDPERALDLMTRHGVRNTFMPPTALKLMRQVPDIRARFRPALRTITCAGEPMGAELLEWGRETFGLSLNEYYGQTECNLVVANCAALLPVKPGSMGVAVPGHEVAIVGADGNPVADGTVGKIAIRRPDPVMFLGYWNNPAATEKKFLGEWLLTGDEGHRDPDGYFWFLGRDDDVITSAGYRIGPGEIEDCLTRHPAVALAAVVGVPDPLRTEAVTAFIVLKPGQAGNAALEEEIRAFVKTRLSPHEYPRRIEFRDSLPMTATGKIKRKELRDAEIARSPRPSS